MEEPAEVITLTRQEGESWGMLIDVDSTYGLWIKNVKPTGAAAKVTALRAGRAAVKVNGTDATTTPKADIKKLLKSSMTLELTMGPDYDQTVIATEPLMQALHKCVDEEKEEALFNAAKDGKHEDVTRLLAHKVDPNKCKDKVSNPDH